MSTYFMKFNSVVHIFNGTVGYYRIITDRRQKKKAF